MQDLDHNRNFALIDTNMLSLGRADGAMDLYHGGLRLKDAAGKIVRAVFVVMMVIAVMERPCERRVSTATGLPT